MKRFMLIFVIGTILLVGQAAAFASDSPQKVRVAFIDVGCYREEVVEDSELDSYMRGVMEYWGRSAIGDAILIETGKKNILIDGGIWGRGRSAVLPYLEKRGIKKLDTVILTHQHGDHYGGLTEVLQSVPAGEVITNALTHKAEAYHRFLEAVKSSGAKRGIVKGGEVFNWGNGVKAEIVQVGGDRIPERDFNNNSVVVRMSYGDTHFLFTGDMEEEEEEALLSSGREIKSQILKVGHHGSSSSSTYDFLRKVRPKIAVISIGKVNRFDLPHDSVVDRIDSMGCKVYVTGLDGSVVVESDGKNYNVGVEKQRTETARKKKSLDDLFYKYESKATTCWRRKEYAEAAKFFQKALAIEPEDVSVRSRLGHCYKKTGRREDAIKEFKEVLKKEPCEPYANLHLGLMYNRRDNNLSKKYLETYLRCHPQARWSSLAKEKLGGIHSYRGWELKKQGKFDGAISEYEKAIAYCDHLAFPHFQLGFLYAYRDKERAQAELKKYLELEPHGKYADSVSWKLRDIREEEDDR